jgi:hypothetical protein
MPDHEDRYDYRVVFGGDRVTHCTECGALVGDQAAHNAFHERLDAIERVQRSLCDQHI